MNETALEAHSRTGEFDLYHLAERLAKEPLLTPEEAFARFALQLQFPDLPDLERISVVQQAAEIYNTIAETDRRITLLYHFTDNQGAQQVTETRQLGRPDTQLYLTAITPQEAKPLASAEAVAGFQKYFKDKIAPASLKEHWQRLLLTLQFKWQHDIQKQRRHKRIVPVGADKLENVIILISKAGQPLSRDEHGEIYTSPFPINHEAPFQVLGPYSTKLK